MAAQRLRVVGGNMHLEPRRLIEPFRPDRAESHGAMCCTNDQQGAREIPSVKSHQKMVWSTGGPPVEAPMATTSMSARDAI